MGTVIMPKMGDAMEEGTLLKWLKAAGDEVSEGDPIAEIETDKVTLEIEAQEDGFMTNLLVEEGTVAPIGTAIATIGTQDEIGQAPEGAAAAPASEEEAEAAGVAQPAAAEVPAASATGESSPAPASGSRPGRSVERAPGERLRASPLVKRLAEEHGIDLSQVAGSGPGGRIIKNDINDFITGAKPIPSAPASAAPATNGQVAAPATSAATPGRAVVRQGDEGRTLADASHDRQADDGIQAGNSSLLCHIKCGHDRCAGVPAIDQRHPRRLRDQGLRQRSDRKGRCPRLARAPGGQHFVGRRRALPARNVDINIAIALDGGLIAPFVPAADGKSLGAIAAMTKDLGRRAREGGLTPEEYQGGTFTISNLGMFDVDEFIAVINPPQAAILAVGSTAEVPVVKDGKIKVGNVMKITLSADHRALDGAQVATFLQSVRKYLENPMLLAVS